MSKYLQALYQYREFVRQAVIRDIKIRYKRSVLGVLWSVLNPLMLMIVMSIAFSVFIRFNLPNYPLFLFSGLIVWQFFQTAVNESLQALVGGNAHIYTKVYIPKASFVIASVTSHFVNLGFAMCSTIFIMAYFKVVPTWPMLTIIGALLIIYFFVLGLAMAAALGNVFFRDIQYVVPVLMTALFYLTPVIYDWNQVPEQYHDFLKLNPMASLVQLMRYPIYYGTVAPLEAWVYSVCFVFVFFGGALFAFSKLENKVVYYA